MAWLNEAGGASKLRDLNPSPSPSPSPRRASTPAREWVKDDQLSRARKTTSYRKRKLDGKISVQDPLDPELGSSEPDHRARASAMPPPFAPLLHSKRAKSSDKTSAAGGPIPVATLAVERANLTKDKRRRTPANSKGHSPLSCSGQQLSQAAEQATLQISHLASESSASRKFTPRQSQQFKHVSETADSSNLHEIRFQGELQEERTAVPEHYKFIPSRVPSSRSSNPQASRSTYFPQQSHAMHMDTMFSVNYDDDEQDLQIDDQIGLPNDSQNHELEEQGNDLREVDMVQAVDVTDEDKAHTEIDEKVQHVDPFAPISDLFPGPHPHLDRALALLERRLEVPYHQDWSQCTHEEWLQGGTQLLEEARAIQYRVAKLLNEQEEDHGRLLTPAHKHKALLQDRIRRLEQSKSNLISFFCHLERPPPVTQEHEEGSHTREEQVNDTSSTLVTNTSAPSEHEMTAGESQ
ncbi:hypothetical protein OIO90_002702 [Microbotryomycetes sp. JL221]|nr:hypothetical protein OIO90_002702 [Microbotryomycetes sp. JL221]